MIYNDIIIDNLEILNEYAKINGEVFKSRAYIKVIDELLNDNNSIKKYEDFLKIESAGDKIKAKVKELIETGKIKEVEEIKKDPLYIFKQNLLSIHGLGPVKINEIINNHKITSIEELKKNTQLLNSKQLIGLKYYDDLNKRISSIEIKVHHNILDDELKKYKNIEYDYVGSFRRGLKKMGDIDILIKKDANFNLTNFINDLKTKNYIIEILALGEHKFMGICKINKKKTARRIDITIAPEDEYYFTLLYFTGSKKFNIGMRTFARKLGYSLSEHGLSQIVNNKIPKINSENDIFKFLNLKYIEPKNRKDFSKIKYN